MRSHEIRAKTMPETISNKTALRRDLLANRQLIAPEVRQAWNKSISERVVAWWETHRIPTLGVYWPIRGEPDLQAAYLALAARGVQLALPVVVDEDAPLGFMAWNPGEAMTKDRFGVSIPASGAGMHPGALLIPCVGFNQQRFRLGYGGGFYDRTLAVAPRPLAVGVGYECARANFDADAHDVALDAVITEATAIDFT